MLKLEKVCKKYKLIISITCIGIVFIMIGLFLTSNAASNKPELNTIDLKDMIVGAELPYLLYSSNDYCIIDMQHGGVIIYDFSQKEIKDRVSYEKLSKAGFKYPVPLISSDGEIIYFAEDSMNAPLKVTHFYSLKNYRLSKVQGEIDYFIQSKDFYSHNIGQSLLSDGFTYGQTCIELDDKVIASRLKKGGSFLSDTEIIFFDKNGEYQDVFPLFHDVVINME